VREIRNGAGEKEGGREGGAYLFIPINSTGKASVMNSFSIATASLMIATTRSSGHLIAHLE